MGYLVLAGKREGRCISGILCDASFRNWAGEPSSTVQCSVIRTSSNLQAVREKFNGVHANVRRNCSERRTRKETTNSDGRSE